MLGGSPSYVKQTLRALLLNVTLATNTHLVSKLYCHVKQRAERLIVLYNRGNFTKGYENALAFM